jgi:lipopolysaccharide export LptBFGC system permease protein LptF
VLEYRPFNQPVIDYYPETPDYFESEYKLPDAMTYGELKDYLEELEASGQTAPELEVELHKKISLPFAVLVMSFVALPFSFRLGRKGTLYGVGIGVLLGMVFFALLAFSSTLGETGALPPLIAVWSPNVAFLILSLYLLLGVHS